MAQLSLYQALTIFAWFPLAFTLAVLLLIARFYERFSGANTHWRLFAVPILAYAAAHVREAAVGMPSDTLADAIQAFSGGILLILTVRLSILMLRPHDIVASVSPPFLLVGGVLGDIGLGFAFLMVGRYTRRMAALNRQPPYHRTYYLAALGVWTAALMRLLSPNMEPELLLAYATVVAISTTFSAVVTWRAWSWLLVERA
ncbi:MAG: hypothetical protein IPK52_19420 [Chloroflexi bacterium]|nr:hypothetical protein [Chloroflexota bacterium]